MRGMCSRTLVFFFLPYYQHFAGAPANFAGRAYWYLQVREEIECGGGAPKRVPPFLLLAVILQGKQGKGRQAEMKENENPRGERALRAVQRMLDVLESKIDSDVKCSVGDFIRLLQLERELKAEQVKEIQVTWQETKKKQE